MKTKLSIAILCLLIFAIGAYLFIQHGVQSEVVTESVKSTDSVIVSPQEARNSVTIDRATLTQGGYMVIRGSDGKRLGQVIEISQYLEPGEHTNIQIILGDFYTYKADDQLIAMIYWDDGDKSFSDLDQPATDKKGEMLARFVETGQSVSIAVTQEVVAHGGTGMETVRYTNSGFQPSKLTVPMGTMVEFVNQSDSEMWVASNVHPAHDILPTFDQFKGVEKGKNYMYTFDKEGTWAYHDHINPAREGIITVN